jgi:hypothetical protein
VPGRDGRVAQDLVASGIASEGQWPALERHRGVGPGLRFATAPQDALGRHREPAEVDEIARLQWGAVDFPVRVAQGGAVPGVEVLDPRPAGGDHDLGVIGRDHRVIQHQVVVGSPADAKNGLLGPRRRARPGHGECGPQGDAIGGRDADPSADPDAVDERACRGTQVFQDEAPRRAEQAAVACGDVCPLDNQIAIDSTPDHPAAFERHAVRLRKLVAARAHASRTGGDGFSRPKGWARQGGLAYRFYRERWRHPRQDCLHFHTGIRPLWSAALAAGRLTTL